MGKRYELGSTREIEFDDYLGQQGEVIGTESPWPEFIEQKLFRWRTPLTILVD